MYAIVDIAGKQYKAEEGKFIYTNQLQAEEGEAVNFENIYLLQDGNNVQVGAPTVEGVKIQGKVLEHSKDDKVTIFKKKRRKGYTRKKGHRQPYSKVMIEKIQK